MQPLHECTRTRGQTAEVVEDQLGRAVSRLIASGYAVLTFRPGAGCLPPNKGLTLGQLHRDPDFTGLAPRAVMMEFLVSLCVVVALFAFKLLIDVVSCAAVTKVFVFWVIVLSCCLDILECTQHTPAFCCDLCSPRGSRHYTRAAGSSTTPHRPLCIVVEGRMSHDLSRIHHLHIW